MKKDKAKLFNDKAAAEKSQADKIVELLEVKQGQNIADIGSGGGFFAFKFADKLGDNGKIFCLDNNEELLSSIDRKNNQRIQTVLYDGKNILLEENSIDLFFMRNVTHHIDNREEYFQQLKKFLKADGKIAVIDYKRGSIFSFHGIIGGHYVNKNDIIEEMKKAGFKVFKDFNFLTDQHFTIFART